MNIRYGSVCSGIEAASCAWESLGWQPAWFSEIEPFPSAVLAHHWPEVANLGDMTKIAAAISSGDVEAPDVLVGGTPCQAFSVAGLRAGLEDARGQLTLSYVELANAIDSKRRENGQQPAIIVWENVPGVLSSKDNAFGCFLGALAGESCELQPAGGKWSYAGCVFGPERTIAWRTLDAQFFGVAQRRRRVFVVASARQDVDPASILFELESVRRDTAPRREAQPAVAALTANGVGTCGADDNQARAGHLIPSKAFRMTAFGKYSDDETASTVKARDYKDATDLAVSFNWQAGGNTSATLGSDENVTGALQASQHPAVCVTGDVTHTLKGEGYDGSEDGTGRGQPIVTFAENSRSEVRYENGDGDIAGVLSSGGGKPGQDIPCVLEPFTLSARGRADGSNFEYRQDGTANALLTPSGVRAGINVGAVAFGMQVRRLMPVECERLQGMPDNHTLIPWRGKSADKCPDGPRYKAIGNSMAVPVMAWIGTRIDMAINISVESIEQIVTEEVSEIAESDSTAQSNQYVQALHELRDKPAHKLKEVGDQWRTPDSLFWGINAMFGPLVLDLFTDGENSKCPAFYTAEDNAITQDWSARLSELNGAAFANPPYSRASKHDGQYITGMSHIINHAFHMRELGGRYVFLIKAATSETWWPEGADHVSFVRGRIGFDAPSWFVPADKDQVPTGAFFAGAIVVFDKTWRGPAISYVSREQLLAQGEAFLEQIRWQAARLNNSTSEVAA